MTDAAFVRYLSAKRTVDDRALNARVWDALLRTAAEWPRVLEVGGGIGTMVERVLDDARLRPRGWTLVDAQPLLIQEARRRLARRSVPGLDLVAADLETWLTTRRDSFDLVVANAFLDLVDMPRVLPRLLPLASAGGLFYFSLTFDGLSALEPVTDPVLEERILGAYHRSMDERMVNGRRSGDSRSGRHLLGLLPRAGYAILEAGASDWLVFPRAGAYHADERFFLECILTFFEESVSARREVSTDELAAWLALRRGQLERGELIYVAHQLDVLARPA